MRLILPMRLILIVALVGALTAGCATEEERGCVTVKRLSKVGEIVLFNATKQCIGAHGLERNADYLKLVEQRLYRSELQNLAGNQCGLQIQTLSTIAAKLAEREFNCVIDVNLHERCMQTASSTLDVMRCTETSTSVSSMQRQKVNSL
jgi:hypothetical protein